MKRFRCVTFGCRVNQYETQAVREQLLSRGYQEVSEGSPMDFLVINSCTVTEAADRECITTLQAFHRAHPHAQIVLTGCLVQRDSELLKTLPGVRLLVGTNQKHRIAQLIETLEPWKTEPRVEIELGKVYGPLRISTFAERSKAFVKVQDGCDRVCAFCKIPYVRGPSRSRPLADLLDEVKRLVNHGFQEIVFTGVALGLWGREWDPQSSLADLIHAANHLPGHFRFRLSSLDPRDLDDRLIDALRFSQRLCHHLHLSLQSGSDSVLNRMNRGYTASWYREQVNKIRGFWPDLGLTTDLIVGFPGETQQQFDESTEFCRGLSFAKVHVFPYSRRRGTSAWFFKDQVEPSVIKLRAKIMRQVTAEVAARFQRRFVGTTQEVLLEEGELGYTGQFLKVHLINAPPPPAVGHLASVRLVRMTSQGLMGEVINFSGDTLDN